MVKDIDKKYSIEELAGREKYILCRGSGEHNKEPCSMCSVRKRLEEHSIDEE